MPTARSTSRPVLSAVVTAETPRLQARRSSRGRGRCARSGVTAMPCRVGCRWKERVAAASESREKVTPGDRVNDPVVVEVNDELGVVARLFRSERDHGVDVHVVTPRLVLTRAEAAQVLAAVERA